jgi:2-oxoglutarate ferredoxin oxidoreductase subunit alpha
MCEYNIERLMNKIRAHTDDLVKYEEFMLDDAEVCIIAYGSISRGAKEAVMKLRSDGIKAGLFRPITIWPSPVAKLQEIGKRFSKIMVTELNKGQYLEEIQRVMKRDDFATLHKANGRPIAPLEMVAKVKEMF